MSVPNETALLNFTCFLSVRLPKPNILYKHVRETNIQSHLLLKVRGEIQSKKKYIEIYILTFKTIPFPFSVQLFNK